MQGSFRTYVSIVMLTLFCTQPTWAISCGPEFIPGSTAEPIAAEYLPIAAFRERLRIVPRGQGTHVFSDINLDLKDQVWAYYNFATSERPTTPEDIPVRKLTVRASTREQMETHLFGRVPRGHEFIGHERLGGPVLVEKVTGLSYNQLFYSLKVERTVVPPDSELSRTGGLNSKFFFDESKGRDNPSERPSDRLKPRNGVDRIDLQLQTSGKPRRMFALSGFRTKAQSSEYDQVIAVGPRFPAPAREYRAELESLGFGPEYIEQIPAGAQLLLLGRDVVEGESHVRGSLMLIHPFKWVDHFGFMALRELAKQSQPQPRPQTSQQRLGPRTRPMLKSRPRPTRGPGTY